MAASVLNDIAKSEKTDIHPEVWEMTIENIQLLFNGILERTILDLTNSRIFSHDYNRALNWIVNDDYNYYYLSFPVICEALEVEPSYLRKQIYNIPKVKKRLTENRILEELLKRNKRT